MTDAQLREAFPQIDWDTPIKITITGDPHPSDVMKNSETYACRYCIAQTGLRGRDVRDRTESYGDVLAHIEREHS